MKNPLLFYLIIFSTLGLTSCGGSGSVGQVDLVLTDSPTDQASSVVVEFTGVSFQPDTGSVISYSFPTPQQIDLAQLQNGATTPLLQSFALPGGHYQWLELEVSATPGATDSYVVLNIGGKHGLVLGPAGQPGLRTAPFDVMPDQGATFLIDFDARKSVLPPSGISTDFSLMPVLRMLDMRAGGNIIGSVATNFPTAANCVPVVYTYAGNVTTPQDLNDTAPAATQPVSESPVKLDNSGEYRFTAAFLPEGTYTLAFTCDAANDDPTKADSLTFNPVGTVKAFAGQTVITAMH